MASEQEKNLSTSEKSPSSVGGWVVDKFKGFVNRLEGMRPGSEQPEKSAAFSAAKIELANSPDVHGADRAQHRFEVADAWDDNMREAAVELNRTDPNMPRTSFEGALNFLENYGNDFAEGARNARARGEDYEDFEAQAAKVAMHRGMAERGDIDSLRWLMGDMEEQLKLMGAWEDREGSASASHQKEIEDLRRVRDALYIRYEQELKKHGSSVVEGAESITKKVSEDSAREAVAAALNPEKEEIDPRQKLGEAINKTIGTLQSDDVRRLFKESLGSIDNLSPERSLEIAKGLRGLYKEFVFGKMPERTQGLSGPEAAAAAQEVQREYTEAVRKLLDDQTRRSS